MKWTSSDASTARMNITEQLLVEWLTRLRRPGDLYIIAMREIPGMADRIRVSVAFPPIDPTNDDVEKVEFSYSENGGVAIVEELPKDVTVKEYVFAQDANVHLELTYLDDAIPPNRSPASSRDFVATDTVPPAAPGELSVTVVGEE